MHQDPRFSRSRPGKHKDVGFFAIIGNNFLLDRIAQILDDLLLGLAGGLTADFDPSPGHPAPQEPLLIECEIVLGQTFGLSDLV